MASHEACIPQQWVRWVVETGVCAMMKNGEAGWDSGKDQATMIQSNNGILFYYILGYFSVVG